MVGRELESYYHKREVDLGAPALQVDGLLVPGASEPVSFEVRAGEVVGFAGLVGAGRTELLETIFGVRRAHGGRVLVDGREVHPGPRRMRSSEGSRSSPRSGTARAST